MVKTGFHSHQTQSWCDFTRSDFVALLECSCKHSRVCLLRLSVLFELVSLLCEEQERKTPHLGFACRATCLFGKRVFFCYLNFSVVEVEKQRVQHFIKRNIVFANAACFTSALYFCNHWKTHKQTNMVCICITRNPPNRDVSSGVRFMQVQWRSKVRYEMIHLLWAVSLSPALVLTQSLLENTVFYCFPQRLRCFGAIARGQRRFGGQIHVSSGWNIDMVLVQ